MEQIRSRGWLLECLWLPWFFSTLLWWFLGRILQSDAINLTIWNLSATLLDMSIEQFLRKLTLCRRLILRESSRLSMLQWLLTLDIALVWWSSPSKVNNKSWLNIGWYLAYFAWYRSILAHYWCPSTKDSTQLHSYLVFLRLVLQYWLFFCCLSTIYPS